MRRQGLVRAVAERTLSVVAWTVVVLAALVLTNGLGGFVRVGLFYLLVLVYFYPWVMGGLAVLVGVSACYLCRTIRRHRRARPYSEWLRT